MIRQRSMVQRFLEVVMSRKNIFEFSSLLITLAILCAGLVGCGSVQPLPTPTSAPSAASAILPTVSAPPATATLLPLPTPTVFPQSSLVPFPTLPNLPPVTGKPTQTPLPAVLPKFPLDGYVMLFKKDNDLYFQDGENSPVKLAHSEGNVYPPYFALLSSDNRKVVFYQDDGNIYSINTDGTQEQVILPKNWLNSLNSGTLLEEVKFVPHTHFLSFQAVWCKEKSSVSQCSKTIFLVDTDTGEIRKLADLGLTIQNFNPVIYDVRFSPNGKMLAVGVAGSVKIYTLDGKIIRQNILPFTPGKSDTLFPSLFWLPDSSGLIAALPDKTVPDPYYMDGSAPAYTIWRYMLDGDTTAQIPFDPPVAGTFEVSPDGNWIVYGGISPVDTKLYVGNLADGKAKVFGNDDLRKNFQWSPDSKHFIHGLAVVTSFDKPPLDGGAGPTWIDTNHFMYLDIPQRNPLIQKERFLVAETRENEVHYYDVGFTYPDLLAIKPNK
jgi:hypothetical protein